MALEDPISEVNAAAMAGGLVLPAVDAAKAAAQSLDGRSIDTDPKTRIIQVIRDAYAKINSGELREVRFEGGLDIGGVIQKSTGRATGAFPLLNWLEFGKATSIGLPNPCTNPRLHSITMDEHRRGLWLEITAEDKDGETTTVHLLLTNERDKTGRAAILDKKVVKPPTPTEKAINEGYAIAKERGYYRFDKGGLDISEKINNYSYAQESLPLPNGQNLGKILSIGLPSVVCANPRLHSITMDEHRRGLWLEITAEDKAGETTTVHLLLTHEEGVTGEAAILDKKVVKPPTPTEKAINEGYAIAKERGYYGFDKGGLDISEKIGNNGKAQESLPLPNGQDIGKQLSIGLPSKDCRDPRLLSITHNPEENSYLLHIYATDRYGLSYEVEVVFSGKEGVTGKDARISYEGKRRSTLPPEFHPRMREGQRTAAILAQRAARKQGGEKHINSIKGECFEQLAGVLLAALYPNERVLPQYCLKVVKDEGYYGLRVDFKVGSQYFEIKWGNATDNIQGSYNDHTGAVGKENYTLLCLCKNHELTDRGIPFKLFSELIEDYHPLAKELETAMELIAHLVHTAKDGDAAVKTECVRKLEIIQRFLYATCHRISTGEESHTILIGQERIAALREALKMLHPPLNDDQLKELIKGTHRRWSTLEAYVEFEGKIHCELIPIRQLVEEEPDKYDLGYCYKMWSTDPDGERYHKPFATFTSHLDFDLLWTLSFMFDAENKSWEDPPNKVEITGERDEHGWFIKPTFTVTVGAETFSFSSHATTDAIKSLDELRVLGKKHGLRLSKEDVKVAQQLLNEGRYGYAIESEVKNEDAASPAK
jgi:hypothetical protein